MKRYLIWPLIILLIIFRYFITKPAYHNGDIVRITSTVYSDPIKYPNSQYFRLKNLKVYLPIFPKISYGDKVVVEGIVDGGKLTAPKLVEIIETKNFAAKFRNKIVDFYMSQLPQPESGLIAGVVLGSKGALTSDFYDRTKVTGVAHVVVASGTNVTFVVIFLMGVLTHFMSRRRAILFVILGIIMYLFISGFEAPLIRAAIMSGVAFLGEEKGKLVSTWRILGLTAAGMLIFKPIWITDIGFILSFVSTASLLLFEKRLNSKLLKLLKLPRLLNEGLSTSLAAQIGVAPILFVTFGQFNIWSPIVNALVLWTIPYLMVLGAASGIVGLIIPFLGKIILYLAYPFLWWFVNLVSLFS